jgi:tetratricopeptide (TPR) repeat protein
MRIVVSRAPGFSGGYSGLAVSAAQLAQMSEDGEALRKEASGAIARALELNPKNGEAYFAKALLAPPADFSQQEAIYRQGLAVDPDDPTLNSSLAALMYDVGRAGDALALQQRAVMLDPLSPRKTAGLAAYESMLGNRARARTVIDRAAEQWPDNLDVWATRLIILSDFGQGAEARLMLSAARSRPNRLEPDLLAAIAAYLESLESPAQAARARAKRALMTAYESNHIGFEATIYLLGRIGELDAAYSLSGRYFTGSDRANGRLDTSPFFRPQSTPLRAHKRFLPLVERLGLVQYWRTHTAPDFCASERNALCSALRRNTPPGQ